MASENIVKFTLKKIVFMNLFSSQMLIHLVLIIVTMMEVNDNYALVTNTKSLHTT